MAHEKELEILQEAIRVLKTAPLTEMSFVVRDTATGCVITVSFNPEKSGIQNPTTVARAISVAMENMLKGGEVYNRALLLAEEEYNKLIQDEIARAEAFLAKHRPVTPKKKEKA